METKDFLEVILGQAAGYATAVIKDAHGQPTVQKFFSYPDELDDMVEYSNKFASEDVYFSPIIFYEQRRIRENAKCVSVVYADADTCPPEKFLLTPSISVETSPNRWHCYWVLDREYDPTEVALMAKKIAYAHKDDGCDLSGWNPTKLLRIANTSNRKYDKTYTVTATANGLLYTLPEIGAVYDHIKVDAVLEPSLEPKPDENIDVVEIFKKIPNNPEIISLYLQDPPPGADLSRRLWKLELELFRAGLSAQEVFSVVRHAKCNKYHRADRLKRLDPDGDLWREVKRAEQTYALEGNSAFKAEIIEEEKEKPVDFLTPEEREVVAASKTFIDKYVDWASKKTDAANEYQIASAFTVLSSAFSDTGHAVPKYGKMGLNLWFMILGETTRSRKSTSRQLMLRVVREYEKFAGYQIDVGSDVTAEGLVKLLSGRDKQTSLFHRDEVQGMFKDFINKTYMATAAERFTELYDGHVPVVVRSTGGSMPGRGMQSERAETNFLMYLMGITSKTADVLTTEYFRSGFLARFIYVIADAPDRSYETEAIQQADEVEVVTRDEEMDLMIRSLYESYLYWQKKGAPFPRPIRLTDEALERFNAFKWEMGNYTEGHEQEESIEPSRQRLALSIWKCAVLLAMYDRSDEVQLKHMLVAIHYSEEWFRNLVRMAGAISASEWQREVDSLEDLIAQKGGRLRYEEAYKRFSNKRKREFDEMIDALKSQARLSIVVENSKIFLEVANVG
jgi:hypothetical protein